MLNWLKGNQRIAPSSTAIKRKQARTALMMQLEPRIMFDAAVAATVDAVIDSRPPDAVAPVAAGADMVARHHTGAAPVKAQPAPADLIHLTVVPVSTDITPSRSIVFIESGLPDFQTLRNALQPNVEVVVLNSNENGLTQIAGHLQGQTGIASIHILSHARDGQLSLGRLTLDQAALQQNATALASIGAALADSGDILLYGCDVAQSQDGIGFIMQLATSTSADVSASDDRTGAAGRGGDWVLEQSAGHVDASEIFVADELAAYDQLLALPAATQQFSDTYWTNNTGGNTVDGFTLAESTGATRASSANSIYFTTGVVKDDPGVAGNYYAEVTWTADHVDLGKFDLDGMRIQSFGGNYRLDFSATSGGSPVSETFTYNGAQGPLVVDLNAALFNDISAFTVRITNLSGATSLANMDLQQVMLADLKGPNTAPLMGNVNSDSVAWAGVGATVLLDNGGNASLTDAEFGALNSGNGNWSGGSLAVQRSGTAISTDVFGLDTSGALFTTSGSNLQSGGQTFATFTNTGGVLTITYTSSGTTATTALVNDVARHINYRNDTPSGDAALRFTLSDGIDSTTADVTATSDTIYVTNTTDTATINAVGGVSFSEAIAIAAADATGSQTIVIDGSLAGQTVQTSAATSLSENLALNMDPAAGVTLSGGTLSIGSGLSLTASNGTGDTAAIATALSGAGGVTKAGAGTVTLSGANTYSGTTSVSAGTLSVSSDGNLGSAAVLLAAGATLDVTGASNIDNAVTLSGNATVSNSANATLSGIISGSSTLTKTGASTLTLSNTNTYSATAVGAGTLSIAGDNNLGSGAVALAGGTTLELTGASNIDNAIVLTGNAAVSTTANATLSGVINGNNNLSKTGAATLTLSASNTYGGTTSLSAGTLSIASDSNLGSGGLTLAAGTTLALTGAANIDNAVTLSGAATVNTSANATLSGNIGGAGSLTKTGANALTLSGSNSYAGTTTVSAGTLSVASDGNLGSSTITLASGTTLAVTGATNIDNAITLSGGNATVQTSGAVTFSGAVGGAGGLIKTGAGTLTLSGGNGFTGNVNLSVGGLTLSGGAAIDNSSAVTAASGTTLTLSSSETIGSLAGAGSVALGANTLTMGGDNTSTSYSGNIGGTGGSITKTGSGTLSLTGTNTNTGSTTISAGTVDAQNGAAIGDTSALSVASGAFLVLSAAETIGSLAGAGSVSLSANTLTTGGDNTSTTFSGALNGNGGLVKNGSGTLALSNAGNSGSMSGGITVAAGTLSVASDNNLSSGSLTLASGSTLDVTGATNIDNAMTLTGSATVNNSANATLSGIISGANNLAKTGASTLTLSGTNSYSGTTVSAGTLSIASDGNLGSGSVSLANGTTFAVTGTTTIDNALTLAGNVTVSNSAAVTVSGPISGNGNLAKSGASPLTLSGTNAAHSGNITVNAGALGIGGDGNLGSGTVTLNGGTTLAVTSGGTINNNLALGGAATLQILSATTWSGVISGSHNLAKTGSSTLTLANTNTLSGTITVTTGTLSVTGTASSITVADGAALTGTGTVDGSVTVQDNGILQPGISSPGTLTINGDLMMASGSGLAVEINGTTAGSDYGQVVVNGTVDVSNAGLSVIHAYVPANGDTYTLIVNDAADAVTGNFDGVSEGSTLVAGGNSTELTASYTGGTSNDFILTAPLYPTVTAVSSSTPDGTWKIGDTIGVSVTFDMAVFVNTSGGTPTLLLETGTVDRALNYVSGSGSTTLVFDYTVQAGDLSADLDYASTGALVLNGGTIQDALNHNASLTLASPGGADSLGANRSLVVDGVRPTAGIVVADTALSAGETSTVTITFSEAVTGLTNADLTIANGTSGAVSSADGGITWTATLTPTASVTATSNLVALNNTGVADLAGNTGTGSTDSNNYAIDTLRPLVSIALADYALAAGETTAVTFAFSEAVSGFSNADIIISNGTLSAVASADGGITWTATFTPGTNIEDAANVVGVDNTGYADATGNAGTGTTGTINFTIDTLRPAATTTVADTILTAGETSTVTITFTEPVTGFTNADLTIANGTLSTVSSADGGITWTATLTPAARIADTTNLVTLDNTGVQDAAGNAGTGTTASNNYAIRTSIPAVTAVSVPANGTYVAGQNLDFTVTLDEAVIVDGTGGVPRIAVTLDTGGTVYAGYLSGSGSTELLFRLTVADGQLDANGVSLGGAIDTNGASVRNAQGDDASVQLNNVESTTGVVVDASAPTASDLILMDASPANADTLHYLLSFSEDVSGVDVNDFVLVTTGSVRADVASVTQVDARTYDIELNNVAGNGTLRVNLNSSGTGIVDTAGNAVTGGLLSAPHTSTVVTPSILVARSENLPPAAPPFSCVITAPLSPSLPSIFDLQADFSTGYPSSIPAAPSIHNVDVGANRRLNLSLPWRPEKFTHWTVVELRSSTGAEVPAWLHYDFTTGTLQGTPPVGFHGTLQIDLVETDSHGQRVIGTIQLHFDDVAQRSDADNSVKPPAKRTAAKAGLDAQFASHVRNTPLDADAASLLRQLHFRTSDRPPTQNHAHF